ncbi:MAG: hypothetical protein VX453_07305 [Acidobacteriota bacterium]|nr:hypothetical protein [Acidobacteriota bacterium]
MLIKSTTPILSSRWRVAVVFALATLFPVTVLLVAVPLVGAWGGFLEASIQRPVAMLSVVSLVAGQWAGGRLGHGVRVRVAFGAAFLIGLPLPLLIVAGLGSLSGHETVTGLAGAFMLAFALTYSLLGAVGVGLSGFGWRRTVQVAVMFAGGGAVAGMVLAGFVAGTAGASAPVEAVVRACGAAAACALPAAVGGWSIETFCLDGSSDYGWLRR